MKNRYTIYEKTSKIILNRHGANGLVSLIRDTNKPEYMKNSISTDVTYGDAQ